MISPIRSAVSVSSPPAVSSVPVVVSVLAGVSVLSSDVLSFDVSVEQPASRPIHRSDRLQVQHKALC